VILLVLVSDPQHHPLTQCATTTSKHAYMGLASNLDVASTIYETMENDLGLLPDICSQHMFIPKRRRICYRRSGTTLGVGGTNSSYKVIVMTHPDTLGHAWERATIGRGTSTSPRTRTRLTFGHSAVHLNHIQSGPSICLLISTPQNRISVCETPPQSYVSQRSNTQAKSSRAFAKSPLCHAISLLYHPTP
jgi:hypothetical protein